MTDADRRVSLLEVAQYHKNRAFTYKQRYHGYQGTLAKVNRPIYKQEWEKHQRWADKLISIADSLTHISGK